jgi:RNA polymerase-interacting CarD/CdnL/TRCF family regulator
LEAQRRFLDSAAKIVKEKTQSANTDWEKRLKVLEDKAKGVVNQEANSVPTAPSGGGVSQSDRDFLAKFGSGELPMTKENVLRYEKISKTY